MCRKEHVSSQYSRSEVVLTFFERSPLDQVLKNDNVHKIQCGFQSPVKISGESAGKAPGGCGCSAAVRGRGARKPPSPVHVLGTPAPLGAQKADPTEGREQRAGLLPDLVKRCASPCWPAACSLPASKGV